MKLFHWDTKIKTKQIHFKNQYLAKDILNYSKEACLWGGQTGRHNIATFPGGGAES